MRGCYSDKNCEQSKHKRPKIRQRGITALTSSENIFYYTITSKCIYVFSATAQPLRAPESLHTWLGSLAKFPGLGSMRVWVPYILLVYLGLYKIQWKPRLFHLHPPSVFCRPPNRRHAIHHTCGQVGLNVICSHSHRSKR